MHNFAESLLKSKKHSSHRIWNIIYERFFPNYTRKKNYEEDMLMQKSGVDDIIEFQGKPIWIDRKVRFKRKDKRIFQDIILEFWSDEERMSPGWICKRTKADYFIYLNLMNAHCYCIPTKSVQLGWQKYHNFWKQKYPKRIRAKNQGWTTVSLGISPEDLDTACSEFGEEVKKLVLPKHLLE